MVNKNTCVNDSTNDMCYPDSDFIMTNFESAIGDSEHLFVFSGVTSLFKDGVERPICDTD